MATKRIKKLNVGFISLCPRGANRIPVLYKEDDQTVELNTLVKADMDKGQLLAVVYAPDMPDAHDESADAEVIRDAAHRAARNGMKVDIRHDGKALTKEQAGVVETFIIQKSDPRFEDMKDADGQTVDVTGGWGVIMQIDDPALRTKYRNGEWQGVSMGGTYELAKAKRGSKSARSIQALIELLGLKNAFAHHSVTLHGDVDMDQAQLTKELGTFKTSLIDEVKGLFKSLADDQHAAAAGVKEGDSAEVRSAKIVLHKAGIKPGETVATTPATAKPAPDAKPLFKGDMADAKAVAAFDVEVKRWEIMSKVDRSDPAALKKAQEELAALKPAEAAKDGELSKEEMEAGVLASDNPEVRRLTIELAKAKRGSNQPAAGADETGVVGKVMGGIILSKEDQAGVSVGNEIAKAAKLMRSGAIGV